MKFPTTTTTTATVSMSSLLLLVVVVVPTLSFTPSSFLSAPYSTTTKHQHQQFVKNQINPPSSTKTKTKTSLYSSIGGLSGKVALTPQGYGFLSTTERVLTQTKRGNNGYYKANSNDKVIDVMGGMTNGGGEDVALVYEKGNLQGIFTETDYIEVCCSLWYSYHYFIMYIYIYVCVMFLIVLVLMIIYLYIHIIIIIIIIIIVCCQKS